MGNRTLLPLGLMLILLVALGSPAAGQIVYGQPTSGNTGFSLTHWKVEGAGLTQEIDQFWVPFSGFVPLGENTEARFYISSANSNLDVATAELDVSGLSDLRIQANRSYADDHVLVSAGLNLPTGKQQLEINEGLPVLDLLAQSFLDFPMRRYGEGFGFNVLFGGARQWGQANVGASIRYEFLGSYKPYEAGDSVVVEDYNPGDLFTATVSGELPRERVTWSASASYTIYTTDKSDGVKTIKQSPHLDLQLGGTYKSEDYTLQGVLAYVIRGDNTRYSDDPIIGDQSIKLYGNELHLAGWLQYPFRETWYALPSAGVKTIGGSDATFAGMEEIGRSTVWNFGGAVGKELGKRFNLEVGGVLFTGSADGGNIDLSGYQLNVSLGAEL
jgi:hypothetical protein